MADLLRAHQYCAHLEHQQIARQVQGGEELGHEVPLFLEYAVHQPVDALIDGSRAYA